MKMNKVMAAAVISAMLLSTTACGASGNTATAGTENSATASTVAETTTETQSEDDVLRGEIETTIGEFQYACQTSDVDAALECLDPGFSQALKSGRLLLNWMSTKNNTDEKVMSALVISIMSIADISVDLTTMDITVNDIVSAGEMATINADLKMACSTGEYRDKIKIRMTKDNDKWYITGVQS